VNGEQQSAPEADHSCLAAILDIESILGDLVRTEEKAIQHAQIVDLKTNDEKTGLDRIFEGPQHEESNIKRGEVASLLHISAPIVARNCMHIPMSHSLPDPEIVSR
jgi:hypothetical protein